MLPFAHPLTPGHAGRKERYGGTEFGDSSDAFLVDKTRLDVVIARSAALPLRALFCTKIFFGLWRTSLGAASAPSHPPALPCVRAACLVPRRCGAATAAPKLGLYRLLGRAVISRPQPGRSSGGESAAQPLAAPLVLGRDLHVRAQAQIAARSNCCVPSAPSPGPLRLFRCCRGQVDAVVRIIATAAHTGQGLAAAGRAGWALDAAGQAMMACMLGRQAKHWLVLLVTSSTSSPNPPARRRDRRRQDFCAPGGRRDPGPHRRDWSNCRAHGGRHAGVLVGG